MSVLDGSSEGAESGPPPSAASGPIGRALFRLSAALALVGGAIILFIMGMTVISVAGRYLFDSPVTGDFELTELGCGVAVFLFFPYTQINGNNIVAEFFTAGLRERHRRFLETIHMLIFTMVAAFLGWRLFEGFLDKMASAESTMLLGLPVWWGYIVAVGACAVLAAVSLWGSARLGFGERG